MEADLQRRAKHNRNSSDFKRRAELKPPGFAAEFADFILHNKKWWLTPILIALFLLGALALLSGTGAAPFLYTLF